MTEPSLRIDKWLWYARFFKSRSMATELCNGSKLRIDGTIISKAHHLVRLGDVLTFPQGHHIRVIKVLALATRRGPAAEAALLYEDMAPPVRETRLPKGTPPPVAPRTRGAGRPTKREGRKTRILRGH